jgi:hypothetical protein
MFTSRISFVFGLLLCLPLATQAGDDFTIDGKFTGEGKLAKLTSLTVKKGENDRKDRYILMFTEKVPKPKDSDMAAMFGDLGDALVITMKPDGKITNCLVAHSAHKEKGGFQSIGEIEFKDLKMADGKISGKLTTSGEQKAFGKTWEVDLKFSAPLPK